MTTDDDDIPAGFTLRHTLRGHLDTINRIAWSPDGRTLASPSDDGTIRLWNTQTGQLLDVLKGGSKYVNSVAWSPDGQLLASGLDNQIILLWDVQTGQSLQTLTDHSNSILTVAWSPDGDTLASGSADNTIRLWNVQTGQSLQTLTDYSHWITSIVWSPDTYTLASGSRDETIRLWNLQTEQPLRILTAHIDDINSIAWSPDGQILASGSDDRTIRLWNPNTGQQIGILEGHTTSINSISFSHDGQFLASKSRGGTVRLWHINTQKEVAMLPEPGSDSWLPGLAFHSTAPVLTTLGEHDTVIRIWDLDIPTILANAAKTPSVHYTNAKVVLVGDSGVGKTGLSLVLNKKPFVPTESTHGRRVWPFDTKRVMRGGRVKETRETLMWDLAGQPGYRLIHQLHLSDVAVTLVVFDAHSETDPFAGVDHWVRALNMAQRVQGSSAVPMKKFLVAARIDRGGKSVSRERIEAVVKELGFDGYFETSAKEGIHIAELMRAIKQAIDWHALPKVTSTALFQRIKAFLVAEKRARRVLSTVDDLYRAFLRSKKAPEETEELRAQFETCIGLVESKGLIRRLSFGDLVLLQPELLDAYASALVNAVRDEPDGLGSIAEERVKTGDFAMPKDERIASREQERLLLIAMVEDLLRYELALREQGEDGAYLVFPSQSTRENPALPDPEGKAVIFGFEGPVANIYTTLVVRLSHSELFMRKELWKNAATYKTRFGGTYGLFLANTGEGRAEFTLFFDNAAREETRFHFEEFVKAHLQRKSLPETLKRRRIFVCQSCGTKLEDVAVRRRRERGFNWMICGVCDARVSILDTEEALMAAPSAQMIEMDRAADSRRKREVAQSTLQGKIATNDFDVFLCHNEEDKAEVKRIGEQLKQLGLLPWLDEWELRPGLPWQHVLEEQIGQIKSAAVFVGAKGNGPWQQMELDAFLREFVKRGIPVIPVLLANAPQEPKLPVFLSGMTYVDFRKSEPNPMRQLVWGITGEKDRG